ncbi:MAG: cation-translocating P-type ATPase [Endomicrobia bacterium]|nr:cation-translocating P-type ATPase [Endomicrobiia bacterium]MCL2506160.1 cation-translocating P-type ATPase [Endomicrobiia bacterium]
MKWTQEKLEDIFKALFTDPHKGLTDIQVAEIQQQKGLNEFEEEKKESILAKVLRSISDLPIIILIIAAAISLFMAIKEGHGYTEVIVIMSIVIINSILSLRQELGAEKALEALKKMNADITVVIRNGSKEKIDVKQLVPGDILVLGAGDKIPADARIITAAGLKVDEAILTGESVPVEKDADAEIEENAPVGDRLNMLFSSCLITNGRTVAVVVATGMDTEVGKIAELLSSTKKTKTPLQKRLLYIGKFMTVVALLSAVTFFVMGVMRGEKLMDMFMLAVALAVAAVPETLMIIVTLTLVYGIQNMAKRNAVVRKINAVETLGNTSVICSDKTGTLTQNKMTIKAVWGVGNEPKNTDDEFGSVEEYLLTILSLCNNASIEKTEDDQEKVIGDPTETAIIRLLQEKGKSKEELLAKFPRVFEIPFDSERKLMTTVHHLDTGGYISITKGAVDRIPITAGATKEEIMRVHDEFAGKALRVIAVAERYYDELPKDLGAEDLERDLKFVGLIGMIDPPRPESVQSVAYAKKAGIKTVMITGDHAITASAIAAEIGILEEGDKTITGEELSVLTDEELTQNVRQYAVYARVSPEDKIRIVRAWKANNEIVAMTGDGVNDAPALKAADVGTAMGITGTDVAKSAAAIVLTDDNFSTIVAAVKEGRKAYDNIRKTVYLLLTCNISEIIIMITAFAFNWGLPVTAIHLLFVNTVADGIPAFMLSREKAEEDIMDKKPIPIKSSVFAEGYGLRIAVMSVVCSIVVFVGFYIGKFVTISAGGIAPSHEVGQTMAFLILGLSSVVHVFNVRSIDKSIFQIGWFSNKPLFWGAMLSVAIMVGVVLVESVTDIFYLVGISLTHWIIAAFLSIFPLIFVEIWKISLQLIRKSGMKK